MKRVGAYSPQTARLIWETVQSIRHSSPPRSTDPKAVYDSWVIKVGAGGITGRVGSVCGTGDGTPYYVDEYGELQPQLDSDGTHPTLEAYNVSEDSVAADEYVIAVKIAGKAVVGFGSGGSGTQMVVFQIEEVDYVSEAYSDDCDDKLEDAQTSYVARVLRRPCGVARVPQETDDETIVVYDRLGSFLQGREESEVVGKIGVAAYLVEDPEYNECEWVITFIDWWREVQVITNVIVTEDEIRFEVERLTVWDNCKLDPISIPLTDCLEEDYQ